LFTPEAAALRQNSRMARGVGDNDWGTESRLDRQNAVGSDGGWSRLPGDSGHEEGDSRSTRRHRPPPRSWLRTLALPVLVCVVIGGLVIYFMGGMLKQG
jgi:hypothetical protein